MHSGRAFPSPEELLERSADGIALLDAEGFTLYSNPAALRLMGLAVPAPGLFLDRLHPDYRNGVRACFAQALVDEGGMGIKVEFRTGRREPDAHRLDLVAPGPDPRPRNRAQLGRRDQRDLILMPRGICSSCS